MAALIASGLKELYCISKKYKALCPNKDSISYLSLTLGYNSVFNNRTKQHST